ncbi:transcriptional repressor [uncultured Rhodospira sp.]|uniref:Fur family transcriptional regulator n=1 Tax=uncultured Rhodospira sp. TaxID=1936189 RepID=UPI00262BF0F7|nr:transcriptional repressor [uncultured Rhodospira sp.]
MKNRRLAPNHVVVFDALKKAGRPVTAYELIDLLRPVGISAPPTVYRALNRLIADGLAHKLESTSAYVACAHAHSNDSVPVFEICDSCGGAHEFADADIGDHLFRRASEHGFTVSRMAIEIHGTCARCR